MKLQLKPSVNSPRSASGNRFKVRAVTKKLISDEIEVIVSHILSLGAAFIVASANSARIFLVTTSFFFYWMRVFPRIQKLFGHSGLLELTEELLEDLLVAIENPGCSK